MMIFADTEEPIKRSVVAIFRSFLYSKARCDLQVTRKLTTEQHVGFTNTGAQAKLSVFVLHSYMYMQHGRCRCMMETWT